MFAHFLYIKGMSALRFFHLGERNAEATPIFRRRHSGRSFENTHKMHVIFIAAGVRNSRNFHIGGRKQIFCIRDAIALQIRHYADAEKLLIQMLGIGTAEIHFFANFINASCALRRKPNFIAQGAEGMIQRMLP